MTEPLTPEDMRLIADNAVDDAIERAERYEHILDEAPPDTWGVVWWDRHILADEVKRLRGLLPPDGWHQFGVHANCRPRARIEVSEAVGEDGLPLWERPVSGRPHIWGEETL